MSDNHHTRKAPPARDLRRRDFVKAAGAATAGLASMLHCSPGPTVGFSFESRWQGTRIWIGPEYWANPLQNWKMQDGEVLAKAAAGRTLHLLTHQAPGSEGGFRMEVTVRLASPNAERALRDSTWAGFSFGIRGALPGYQSALVRPAESITAGIRGDGHVFCGRSTGDALPLDSPVRLTLIIRSTGSECEAELSAQPLSGGPAAIVTEPLLPSQLSGNLALAAQTPGNPGPEASGVEWGFRDWKAGGPQLVVSPEQTFGPILWTQYTLSQRILKLAALFPPLGDSDEWNAQLQTKQDGGAWQSIATVPIERLSRTAIFRVADWDDTKNTEYRVAYSWQNREHHWGGIIRKDPHGKPQLRIGVFSCDHGEVFPQHRMVRNVKRQDPDILYFAGDQIYENYGGFGVARDKPAEEAMLDYLRKFWQFGWTWRALLSDRPSIVIPDDHDVFQGNIWGQGGRKLPPWKQGMGFEQGGFLMPVDWVNAVQRTQSGHLPDPIDSAPCGSGIEVYFTELRYGGASFAIVEDRKFKTGPDSILSAQQKARAQTNPQIVDVQGAELLGPRQEAFLRNWAKTSSDANFRLVCCQTIFCKVTTHIGPKLEPREIDLDTGAWPQSGRRRALSILRPAQGVIMLHGDQHLGSLLRHGINDWEDGPLAFMVPGTSNGFPRAWWPEKPGENQQPGSPDWTGRYRDSFGNRMTILGAANPEKESNTREGQQGLDADEVAHRKGSGHGIVVLDRAAQTVTFEMWRHAFDAAQVKPEDQFAGFPVTVPLSDQTA